MGSVTLPLDEIKHWGKKCGPLKEQKRSPR
jgi:hypothetical protein